MVILLNRGNWDRDRNVGNLNKCAKKRGKKREWDEWRKKCEGYMVLGPLWVFGCSSTVVVEGVCFRDCRGMGGCD
jgi:hypothetical protein